MAFSGRSFGRGKPSLDPVPRVLVYCEDTQSGKVYVEEAASYFRVRAQIEVAHCGKTDPMGIVTAAVARVGEFESIFCVIDRDSHQHWERALRLADGYEKVTVIPSYPCFEYWLLLHFCYSRRPYLRAGSNSPADMCVKELRNEERLGKYDKGKMSGIFQKLQPKLSDARRNSTRASKDADDTGEPNPSTKIHDLIGFFEELEQRYS